MTNKELQEHMETMIKLRFDHVDSRFDRLEEELKVMRARYVKLTVVIATLVTAGGQTIDFKALVGLFGAGM
jgi:hypothetical protein